MPYDKKNYIPEAVSDRSQDIIMQAYHCTWVVPLAVKNESEEYEFCEDLKSKAGSKS